MNEKENVVRVSLALPSDLHSLLHRLQVASRKAHGAHWPAPMGQIIAGLIDPDTLLEIVIEAEGAVKALEQEARPLAKRGRPRKNNAA